MKAYILMVLSAILLGGCLSPAVKRPAESIEQIRPQNPSGYRSSKYVLAESRQIHNNPFTKPEYLNLALQQNDSGKWVIVRTESGAFSPQTTQFLSVNLIQPHLVTLWFWQTSKSNYLIDPAGYLQCRSEATRFCKSPFTVRIEGNTSNSEYPVTYKYDLDRIFFLLDTLDGSIVKHIRKEKEERDQWREKQKQLIQKTRLNTTNQ